MVDVVIPILLNGLAEAAIVFFVAVGLTLVFSVLRILNVAHGSFYAIGAYLAAALGLWMMGAQLSPWLTLPSLIVSAVLVGLVFGPVVERWLLRWTYDKTEMVQILVTFGLFLILEDLQRLVFGVQPYFEATPMDLLGFSTIAGIPYPNYQLILILLAVVVMFGLRLLLRWTRFGKMMVAVVSNREMAQSQGVDANKVFMAAFTFGVFLAALGGALASPTAGVAPGLGADTVVLAFAVATIGGLGQIEGAGIAALIVGLATSVAIFYFPQFDAVAPYIVMLVILLVRPYGLLGVDTTRKI